LEQSDGSRRQIRCQGDPGLGKSALTCGVPAANSPTIEGVAMATKKLVRLECDGCGNKVTFDAEVELTEAQQKEAGSWLAIIFNDKPRADFCRAGCAVNFLRQQSEIKLTE
jgi:hypothetical protein